MPAERPTTACPDTDDLLAIADRIAAHAGAARGRAARLSTATAHAGWHGVAANSFASSAQSVAGGLRISAGRLDDAAAALRRHARQAAHHLAVLRHLEHDAVQLGKDVAGDVVHAGVDVAHAIGL